MTKSIGVQIFEVHKIEYPHTCSNVRAWASSKILSRLQKTVQSLNCTKSFLKKATYHCSSKLGSLQTKF